MNWLIDPDQGLLFFVLWSFIGLGVCAICMCNPYPPYTDWSRLQRIAFHIITGPAGWATGIWKLLSFY